MSEFYTQGRRCKPCYRAAQNARYHATKPPLKVRVKADPEVQRARNKATAYQKRYGITIEDRDLMLAAQGGVCGSCGTDDPGADRDWCTDHDHACCPERARSCGKCIRGILCFRCNTMLGHSLDRVENLLAGAAYLIAWEEKKCLTR